MNELENEIARELRDIRGEREAEATALEDAKTSFAEELKAALGDDMKEVLSAEPEETEKKGAVSKFFEKLVRVCR